VPVNRVALKVSQLGNGLPPASLAVIGQRIAVDVGETATGIVIDTAVSSGEVTSDSGTATTGASFTA